MQSPYEGGGAEGLVCAEMVEDADVVREGPREDVLDWTEPAGAGSEDIA